MFLTWLNKINLGYFVTSVKFTTTFRYVLKIKIIIVINLLQILNFHQKFIIFSIAIFLRNSYPNSPFFNVGAHYFDFILYKNVTYF